MAWFRLVYAAILGAALLHFADVLMLISSHNYLSTLGTEQVSIHVLLSINGFYEMWSIGLIIFGIHIFFLGYLILRSGYIPKILGVLLIIAFFGYLITNAANVLLPDYENYKTTLDRIFIIPMLSEVALGIWLLWKAGHIPDTHA